MSILDDRDVRAVLFILGAIALCFVALWGFLNRSVPGLMVTAAGLLFGMVLWHWLAVHDRQELGAVHFRFEHEQPNQHLYPRTGQ